MGERIFKISGNYMQDGKWAEPDPSFEGKIVVKEDGEFVGYCNELYAEALNDPGCEIRYLTGVLDSNEQSGHYGIAFYKMCNNSKPGTIMYCQFDLMNPKTGSWAGLLFGRFMPEGGANLKLEEDEYTEEEAKRIRDTFDNLDKNDCCHEWLLKELDCCRNMVVNMEI